MKKEVLIAIIIGLSMGLVITYGVYRVRKTFVSEPATDVTTSPSPTADTVAKTVLAVHSPEDGLVQTENTTNVTGTTLPNAFVVVFVNNQDYITESDDSGNFTFTAELEDQTNVITVHVIDEDGQTYSEERLVVVSNALEEAASDDEAGNQSATQSAQTTQTEDNQ